MLVNNKKKKNSESNKTLSFHVSRKVSKKKEGKKKVSRAVARLIEHVVGERERERETLFANFWTRGMVGRIPGVCGKNIKYQLARIPF